MASQPTGPDQEDRDNPGDTQTNPAGGVFSPEPAEGADDRPGEQPGSPAG